MIWYQHVYNIFMLSFHVLTHKKKSQRAKERCSHLILEIKICIWDQPTPLPSRKALQQLRCTLDSAHPETSLELIWSKLAEDLRHPLHSHFTQLWNFITSDSEDDAFLDFQGENAEYIRFLMLSLSEELFDLGLSSLKAETGSK